MPSPAGEELNATLVVGLRLDEYGGDMYPLDDWNIGIVSGDV